MKLVSVTEQVKLATKHKWVWARMRELNGDMEFRELVFQIHEDLTHEDITGSEWIVAGMPMVRTVKVDKGDAEAIEVHYDSWALVRGVYAYNFVFSPDVFDCFGEFVPESTFLELVSKLRTVIEENQE